MKAIKLPVLLMLLGFTTCALAQQSAVPAKDENAMFSKVETEAAYPGGDDGWRKFLIKNLNTNVTVKNEAPAGYYTVIAKFIVNKTGDLTNISCETKLGYGMEDEVIRVVEKSGKWLPAQQDGKPVNAYRRQPITFAVVNDNIALDTKEPYTFFLGMENEIGIAASKVKPEDLQVTISKGSIKQIAGGKYIVTVTQQGRVLLTLHNAKKDKEIGVASFEVKAVK